MTQYEFAKAVGVEGQDSVSDWERDKVQPPFHRLDAMLKLVDPSYSMDQCLVLPWEASEHERKYLAIFDVVRGVSPLIDGHEKPRQKPAQVRPEANRGRGLK